MGKEPLYSIYLMHRGDLGQHMVSTWGLIDEERHLTIQLEAILDIIERQLQSWAFIAHWSRWGDLPYEDAI